MTGVLQVLMGAAGSGGGVTINFTNTTLLAKTDVVGTGQTAQSGYVIRTTGEVDWEYIINAVGSSTNIETGISPSTAVANYEVYPTLLTGTTPAGPAMLTWHPITSDLNWFVTQLGSLGITQCSMNMQIRQIGTGTVLDTWGVELIAEVTA